MIPMMQGGEKSDEGQAKWIWEDGEPQPRNQWRCFRRTFDLNELVNEAWLHITADSRYTVYANGRFIGSGPVRGWPATPFYDSYEISQCLLPGRNVIAVVVQHYGISTFQYIEGRGGLLARLELVGEDRREVIGSDRSWRTHIHEDYGRSAERICCQLGWAEICVAGNMDPRWKEPGFADGAWEHATELGGAETLPWRTAIPRDIPPLQEAAVYPARVEAARRVASRGQAISLDLQPNFFPNHRDANPKHVLGLLVYVLQSPVDMPGLIRFPWDNWLSTYGSIAVNGIVHDVSDNREVSVQLRKGDNYFAMRIDGTAHLSSVFFHLDTPHPVAFTIPDAPESGFATVGPFHWQSPLQTGDKPQMGSGQQEAEGGGSRSEREQRFERAWQCTDWAGLLEFAELIKPVAPGQRCLDNVYMPNVYREVLQELEVSAALQQMILPNSTFSTVFPDASGDVEVLLDFGQEVTGYVAFEIDAPQGTVVDFYGAENVLADRTIEHTEGMNNTLRYVAAKGRQTYRSFVRRGFRYLAVTFRAAGGPVRIYDIHIQFSTFPTASIGRMECSDWQLNRLWEVSRHTLRLCMEDTFVDCPVYEQTYWVGDARNVSLVNYYNYGSYDLIRRCLNLVRGSLERSTISESQVPSGWHNVLSTWSLLWVVACKEYYLYSADSDFLRDIYADLSANVQGFLAGLDDRGLVVIHAWNMLEWAPMDTPDDGFVTHLNAGLAHALTAMSCIADWLERVEEAEAWRKAAAQMKEAINAHLWDETKQAYVDCLHADGKPSQTFSMQTQVMVYWADCVSDSRKARLEQYLKQPPEAFVPIVNPFMMFFYFEALMKLDRSRQMLGLISQVWGGMIEQGTSTCWETVSRPDMDRPTRSYCHAWSTAPGYFMGAYLLGVRPLAPGFAKVFIDPLPCHLQWARGSVPVPQGRIDVEWTRTASGVTLSYVAPPGIEVVLGEGVIRREAGAYD